MCLICGGSVDDGAPTRSDGVVFDCPKHGAYAVARAALPRFVRLSREAKMAALERAKLFAVQRHGEVVVTALDL